MMTTQAVNGIANALMARLIFTGYAFRSGSSLTSYKDIVYNLLAFFVLCPALIMLVVEGRADHKTLNDSYASKLTLLFLLLLGALILAEFLSRKVVAALGQLRTLTHELPASMALKSVDIVWPESGILESNHLIKNFREMADSLNAQFDEVRKVNELLEQRVELRTEELKKSENLLRTLMLTIPDLVWLKDVDGNYLFCNPEFERFFGAREADIVGKTDYDFVSADQADFFREHDYKAMVAGKPTSNEEWITYAADGHCAFVEAIKTPMYNSSGQIVGVLGISRDLTERKQHEEELLQAKVAAESANTAKSQFLANMSHEIRTPMNGLLGMTQLLEMTDLTPEQCEYVAALKLSGKNLLSLINDILDLSKMEAGKVTLELAKFGLHRCINEIVLMQRSLVHDKGLVLDVHVAENIPSVLVGDQLRIKQILLNLLGNSIKFTKVGTITVTAQLLEQHDSSVLVGITIRDNGIGISTDALDKIFKPFVQEDGSISRQFGGTGLGLSISQRLAELMGGSIAAESIQGVGSSFTLVLPFEFSRTDEAAADSLLTAVPPWDGPLLRILLVEDNPINSTFGISLLKKLGHSVVAVENGRECLAELEKSRFDLVLMDIQMPVMTGEEALFEIRRKEQHTDVNQPVIALTAYALRGEKERFLQAGFDGFISKPLAIAELSREMHRVVSKQKLS
jgi:PAS domain S-box-containing protein